MVDVCNFFSQVSRKSLKSAGSYQEYRTKPQPTPVQHQEMAPIYSPPILTGNVIWVVGGPGSNKYNKVVEVMKNHSTWSVLHTGMTGLIIPRAVFPPPTQTTTKHGDREPGSQAYLIK